MSLIKVKNIIKKEAWSGFPAQELWIRENDLYFWAYDKNKEKIYITEGRYVGDIENQLPKLEYKTVEYDNVDNFVDDIIQKKESEGYECFASQLFV